MTSMAWQRRTPDTIADADTDTVLSAFARTVDACGDQPALSVKREGLWRTQTWAGYADYAARIAAGLRHQGVKRGDHVVLLMANSPAFYWVDMACLLVGAIPVSVYNSPAVDRLAYILQDCRPALIVAEDEARLRYVRDAIVEADIASVVVCVEGESDGVLGLDQLLTSEPVDLHEAVAAAKPADYAVMLYTSGTTGEPKGVPLTHRNMIFAVQSFTARAGTLLTGEVQVSYLPMAHIGERFATHYFHLVHGSHVYCCSQMAELPQVLRDARPHMYFGAPRMWEMLYVVIQQQLAGDGELAARFAAERANAALPREAVPAVLAAFGVDRVRVALVGSAPLPGHIHDFWLSLGVPLSDCYGQTETSGMGAWNPRDIVQGTVGTPTPGVHVRIDETGEIQQYGAQVFGGYYNRAQKTQAAFTEDGWFRTGDLGRFDGAGNLVVWGRQGDMIVPTSGHNVHPAAIETALVRHPQIAQVCVVGTRRPHLAAIVLPAPADAMNASGGEDIRREEIAAAIATLNETLPGAERVRQFYVVEDHWSLDSDVLTATGKMKREGVQRRYAEEIELMYAEVQSAGAWSDTAPN